MAVCKFFLEGRCRFGDKCKNQHPGQSSTSGPPTQNVFATSNRGSSNRFEPLENRISGFGGHGSSDHFTPSGERFGGAGGGGGNKRIPGSFAQNYNNKSRGFDPRDSNRDRRNDVTHHRNSYGITVGGLESDLKSNRPIWIMSCYGPGEYPATQLFGGYPLEQSPEELRQAHYLAVASGNPQESAQMEQELAAISNHQVENVLNDLHGAIEYVAMGKDQHPNRWDELKENAQKGKQGLFTVANQRTRRGVFRDVSRASREAAMAQPGSNQAPSLQQSTGFPNVSPSGTGSQSSRPGFFFGSDQQSVSGSGLHNGSYHVPGFGAIQSSSSNFGDNRSSFSGWPPAAQQPQANAYSQSQPQSTFGQPFETAPNSQFQQQQAPSPFGQLSQPIVPAPGSPMDSSVPCNAFGGEKFGTLNAFTNTTAPPPLGNAFGTNAQLPNALRNMPIGTASATAQPPANTDGVFAEANPAPTTTNGASNENGTACTVSAGLTAVNGISSVDTSSEAGQSELEQAYRYMVQHGKFKNGIMPETPPDPIWLQ